MKTVEEPKSTITKFITASGSIYQVDNQQKKIRRIGDPTLTRRVSDEWKSFSKLSPIVPGRSVAIFWGDPEPPLQETVELLKDGGAYLPFTTTNIVVSVVEESSGELN